MLYNWNIVGHQRQLERLEKEIGSQNIAHAYLFSGPLQGGKFSVAKTFANILQCTNNFCHQCDVCKQIKAGTHPDTIIMADNGESIKIDQVRELIRSTNLTSQSDRRIVLIENMERMPIEAQNSFLKTLEEPAGNTIFLLTTSHIDQILLTIQSRVRQYHFSTIEDQELLTFLKKTYGERSNLTEVVSLAQGRPGLAIDWLNDDELFSQQKTVYNRIESFLKKNDLAAKFQFIEGIEKESEQVVIFIDAFSRYLRKLIYDYMQLPAHPLKSRFSLKELVNLFDVLEKTRYFIRRNVNKKLALENLLIQTEK